MSTLFKFLLYPCLLMILFSCTVSNNVYINNPVPLGPGNMQNYIGGGTGQEPVIEGVEEDGDLIFSDEITTVPILAAGGEIGLNKRLDLRYAVHFPYVVGGFGFRLGIQHSLYDTWYKFNAAVGMDLGFVIAHDSLKVFGTSTPMNVETKGAINGDFFMPFSWRFSEKYELYLTPRISLNTFYIKKNEDFQSSRGFNLTYPALSLGFRIKNVYIEATGFVYDQKYYPNFGIVYLFKSININETKNPFPEQE